MNIVQGNIEPMQVFIFQGVPHLYTHIKTDTQKLTAYTRTETGKFYHLGTCQLSSCFSEEFSVYRENGKSERTHARKSHKFIWLLSMMIRNPMILYGVLSFKGQYKIIDWRGGNNLI